jgi:hypothetical protein
MKLLCNLQAACKASRFVFDNCWFRRLAHNDELLVRHHDDTGELREPDANVHESLRQDQPINVASHIC